MSHETGPHETSSGPVVVTDTVAWWALRAGTTAALRHRRVGVEVVVRDPDGRVLLVPGQRGLMLPSDRVMPGEAPLDAAHRALADAADARPARLLVIECAGHWGRASTDLTLVLDGGVVPGTGGGTAGTRLRPTFRNPAAARRLLTAAGGRRLRAAVDALRVPAPVLRHRVGRPPCCPEASALWLEYVAWQLSDELLRIDHTQVYPITVQRVDGDRVVVGADADTRKPLPFGMLWADGHAELTAGVREVAGGVERTVARVTAGTLSPGLAACFDTPVFAGTPASRGLPFTDVELDGELGPLPAWRVPPRSGALAAEDIWVIAIHGRGAVRGEALRVLPALADAGVSTLVVTYRGDLGMSSAPDGLCRLGDTEWRDVAAAVRFAASRGARRVVLYGWSMGGMLALTAIHRMSPEQVRLVRGIVLDSPLLDWSETVDLQARQRGVPPPLAHAAKLTAARRVGVDLAELDQVAAATRLRVPVLLFADLADLTVPPGPAVRFAATRPDLVTLVTSESGHARGWNEDHRRYEAALTAFLHGLDG